MPKNKGKGGKNRRRGKNEKDGEQRPLLYREDGQVYAKVEKILGNARLSLECFDGKRRICQIRGKMRKKVWINMSDIVLVSLREFQDDKGDVIHKFTPDEARRLKQQGEIPECVNVDEIQDIEFNADEEVEIDIEEQRNLDMPTSESDSEEETEEDSDEEVTKQQRNAKWNRQHQRPIQSNADRYIERI